MARRMKDSGIEWIGEIPEGWSISRIKHVAEFEPKCDTSNLSSDSIITYTPMECVKNGFFENRTASYDSLATSLTPFQEGDIVMAKVTPCFENGNIAVMSNLSSGFGLGSSELFVFRPFLIDTRYFFYWLQNNGFIHRACSTMTGTGGLKRVSPYFVRNCEIHLPPATDQHRIAAYLDIQCAKINAVLEQTRNSIEEYKKLKQAVITQAVTKGIRPGRKMKDSGIEWIGEVPEEWTVVRLKYLMKEIVDCPHETPIYSSDGEFYVIRTADQDYANLREDRNMFRLEKDEYINRIRRLSLEKDDIVYGREGERWGLACLVPQSNKYCLGQRMMQFRCNQSIVSPLFAVYALSSTHIRRQGEIDTFGSTSPHVNISTIRNYRIPMPPFEEQMEIETFISEKFGILNTIIARKEHCLNELESYKKSLIYECVTGKREV